MGSSAKTFDIEVVARMIINKTLNFSNLVMD